MIQCSIEGNVAYPASGMKIKMVLQNPFIKNSGDHTYEITFPMDILENIQVFGNINRIDVAKGNVNFSDCRLLDGNRLLVSGTGKVTGITQDSVKLQILGTSADAKTTAGEKFIDELTYPEIDNTSKSWCQMNLVEVPQSVITNGYGGVKGQYVFFTVMNESTGQKYNFIKQWHYAPVGNKTYMKRPTLQPNLIFVLTKVLESTGYTVAENDYNVSPWTNLYIINLKRSVKIAGSLPHIKVKTFLDEFCKLFNAVLIYDEPSKTVRIKSYNTISSAGRTAITPEDEFSTEYDEDGVSYIGSDNIAYELEDCADRDLPREIPAEAFENFTLRHYATLAEMYSAVAGMTEQQKMTSLFLCDNTGYRYYRMVTMNEQEVMQDAPCGFFTPLIKQGNTYRGSTTDLKIIPVPIGLSEVLDEEDYTWHQEGYSVGKCKMPCAEGPTEDAPASTDEEEYMTVSDVLDEGMSPEERENEDSNMKLAFLQESSEFFSASDGVLGFDYYVLKAFCDQRESNVSLPWSLALTAPGTIQNYVGRYHDAAVTIDAHIQIVVKFLSTELPDPKNIFVIANKLFLCSKIEAEVNDDGLNEMMTGYFYEVTAMS